MEIFSEYFKKKHILSEVDARIKLIVTLILLGMVLNYRGFFFPLIITMLCFLLLRMMKIPLKVFILRFSEPFFIALVLLILKIFFTGEDVIFSLPFGIFTLTGHRDGLIEGLLIASRIMGAVSIVALLGFSTPFSEFIAGLSWFKVPKVFTEITMLAYRYVFVLIEDAMVIYNSQKNRLGYSNLRRGLNSFGILTGSLVLKAFEQSQNTATAMIQRGYDGNMPMLKHQPFNLTEVAVSVLLIIALGVIWKI